MKKIFTLLLLSSAWLSTAQTNFTPGAWGASLVGYWQFENAANLGLATVGPNLTLYAGVPSFAFTQVAGPNATDKAIHKPFAGTYAECANPISANGGGTNTNIYSIMYDFSVPNISWNSFLNTGHTDVDGELFINSSGNLGSNACFSVGGSGGYSTNAITTNTWYRLILTVDLTQANFADQSVLYLDGVKILEPKTNKGVDSRVSLAALFDILGDNGDDEDEFNLGQVALFNRQLTAMEALTLGGATLATPKFSAADNTLKVYPNPVSSNARISFNMSSASKNANIELIDMTGRVVENIYRGSLDQGEQTISWDLKSKYNTGTYLVKLSSENSNQVYSILMK
jgi:hypothetical protein